MTDVIDLIERNGFKRYRRFELILGSPRRGICYEKQCNDASCFQYKNKRNVSFVRGSEFRTRSRVVVRTKYFSFTFEDLGVISLWT